MKRREIKCELEDWWSDHSEPMGDFVKRISGLFDSIPEEWKHTAVVEFDGGSTEVSGHVEFFYVRQQTDEEVAAEKARHRQYAAESERAERKRYEELKAKYDPPTSQ